MKKIIFFTISCVLSLLISPAWGFSTHQISVKRTFSTLNSIVGNSITVTIRATNNETNKLHGFYFTDHIPSGLSIQTEKVAVNGRTISDYAVEAGTEGDIYTNYVPYRWILESPPLFEENNPINDSESVEITYSVSSHQAGSFRFDQFSWAGYFQNSEDETQAAFGHSIQNDKQTITFDKSSFTAVDDEYAVEEGETLVLRAPGVLANDTESEGNPVSAALNSNVSNGSLTLNSDGSFTYTHDGSETTVDSFTYHATDGSSHSNSATATINVTPVNDAPVANNDEIETKENVPVIIDVCLNDMDADGTIDPTSVKTTSNPSHGMTEVNNDGTVKYAPNSGYKGSDSFSYTLKDDMESVSNEAMVIISVKGESDGGGNGGGGGCFINCISYDKI